MRINHGLGGKRSVGPVMLTIGTFDGVHRGHQRLLTATVAAARRVGGRSVALTFDPHPHRVIEPEHAPLMVSSVSERCDRIAATGIDETCVLEFTQDVMRWSAHEFLERIDTAMELSGLLIGTDFALGHQRRGDLRFLRQWGRRRDVRVHGIAPVRDPHGPLSSTRIRAALTAGDVTTVTRLLGHPWFLDAEVEHGNKMGRTLGFPTANLATGPHRCLPATGIYMGWARVRDRWHRSAASIGYRPTFADDRLTVEAHLLDFDEDIYGETVRTVLTGRLREERAFSDVTALIAQMRRDVQTTRRRLSDRPPPSDLDPLTGSVGSRR